MILPSLVVTACMALMIGLVVFINNPRGLLNKVYVIFSLFAAFWMLANALTLQSSQLTPSIGVKQAANQAIVLFTTVTALAFLLFAEVFNGLQKKMRNITLALVALSVIINCFVFTNAYSFIENGEVSPGKYYWIFTLCIAMYVTLTAYALFSSGNRPGISDTTKKQLQYLRIGYILAVVPSFIVGGVLATFYASDITALSPVFLIFFLGFAAFAIVKHGLFDIRSFVARSLGYILSLGLIVVTTLVLVYIVSSSTLGDNLSQNEQAFIYAIFVVALAIAYQPIKRLFDRLTNRLFYRDAYDSQQLLDELNQTLVSTIDIEPLLSNTSEILQRYLKANFATFAIREGEEDILRFLGSENFTKHEDIAQHRPLLLDHGSKVIVTNLLENDQRELKRFLFDEHIDVMARLTADSQVEGVGYLLLGEKKSGNPYTAQDIGVIEIVANELVIAVQNALQFDEIQRFNVTLQEKVDTATRQLRKTNDKLKALDETKDEFISMASHQLRTPLTSVKGYMSMVLEGDAGKINDNQRKLLSQAFISSQRMVYLIADLLNVSRLKTGKFIVEALPINLADIIEGEVEQLKETAAGRNLTLTFKKPKDFPILMLDETKTRQVIMNFMDNALHYTPSGGHIKVNLEDKGDTVEYTVVDDGIGVPKSEQHHLFTKFYRAGNAQKARPDGTGLGLFMAKKVIVAQNGSIIFKSQPNKGSTFGFSFAKDKLPKPPAEKP